MTEVKDLLELSGLSVTYPLKGGEVAALRNVSIRIPSVGYTVGVVGESGSGKTTLGLSILNVIPRPGRIVSGGVKYAGSDVLGMSSEECRTYRWEEVAMVFQYAMNSLNPVAKVIDSIVEVIVEHKHVAKEEATKTALKLLAEVGIDGSRAYDFPHQFSGGMRQRVMIALALALSPKLLIVDEPTSAIDVVVQKQILSLLKREVAERGLSLIFITHEVAILYGMVENVIVMYKGEIVETGRLEEVLAKPMHPYTEMLTSNILTLTSSLDVMDRAELYAADSPENACPYSNRCKYVFERCRRERPVLAVVGAGRSVACHKYTQA